MQTQAELRCGVREEEAKSEMRNPKLKRMLNAQIPNGPHQGFTLVELLAVMALVGLWVAMLAPAVTHTQTGSKVWQCQNNQRQLMAAWQAWAEDNNGQLLACQNLASPRPVWMTGVLDFNGGNLSNWDPSRDIAKSPLWPYLGQRAQLFRCPADQSSVIAGGERKPRVRSISMSSVFGQGEWFDGNGYGSTSQLWMTYDKLLAIRIPAKTFVFADEHPDSINDGSLAVACTGNQPDDPPGSAKIIDFPASFHNGACRISFADGHTELHRWTGARIRPLATYTGTMPLNVLAGDSWVDTHWLAERTTVRK